MFAIIYLQHNDNKPRVIYSCVAVHKDTAALSRDIPFAEFPLTVVVMPLDKPEKPELHVVDLERRSTVWGYWPDDN